MTARYYSRPIEPPADLKEGLANFVQMIINRIEAGDPHEALLIAVDLWNDLQGDTYASAIEPAKRPDTIPLSEHFEQLTKGKTEAYRKGFADGQRAKQAELKKLLGDA